MAEAALKIVEESKPIRLDIGCGRAKKEGFIGIDQLPMDGVDVVMDVRARWPYEDETVDEIHCSHFVEHLTGAERVQFFNELYRVLKKGAKATIIVPHWSSSRAYGDFTHQWPPMGEFYYYYLNRTWREANAPHTDKKWNSTGHDCDFEAVGGYGMHAALIPRNSEYQQHAMSWWKEACQDMHTTLTKK